MSPKNIFSVTPVKSLLVLLALAATAWWGATHYQAARTITYVIPPGASQKLAKGEEVIDMPRQLVVYVGDTIIIENQDEAVHAFGPFILLPHTKLTKKFKTARIYQSACTFHQDKQMTLVVNPAPWDILNTIK